MQFTARAWTTNRAADRHQFDFPSSLFNVGSIASAQIA
jgi:hypothetical protein